MKGDCFMIQESGAMVGWVSDGLAWLMDDARRRSGEVDFGVLWCLAGKPWPHYRISWIRDTGELYAVEQGNFMDVGPDLDLMVYVLGHYRTLDEVEEELAGWADYGFVIGPFTKGISHE